MKDSLGAIHTLAYEKRKKHFFNRDKANNERFQAPIYSQTVTETTNPPEILTHITIPAISYGKYFNIIDSLGTCSDYRAYGFDKTPYSDAFDTLSVFRTNPDSRNIVGLKFDGAITAYSSLRPGFDENGHPYNDTTLLITIPTSENSIEEIGCYKHSVDRVTPPKNRPLYQSILISTESHISQHQAVLPITQIYEQVVPEKYIGLTLKEMNNIALEADIHDLSFNHFFPDHQSLKLLAVCLQAIHNIPRLNSRQFQIVAPESNQTTRTAISEIINCLLEIKFPLASEYVLCNNTQGIFTSFNHSFGTTYISNSELSGPYLDFATNLESLDIGLPTSQVTAQIKAIAKSCGIIQQ